MPASTPADLSIRPFAAADYAAVAAVRCAALPDYPLSLDEMRHEDDALRTSGLRSERVVAERDGQIVGYGQSAQPMWLRVPPTNPAGRQATTGGDDRLGPVLGLPGAWLSAASRGCDQSRERCRQDARA